MKKQCLYCGNDFITHNGGKLQKYCSYSCRRKHWRKVTGKEKHRISQKKQDEKDKLNPKKRFSEIKYHANIRKHDFTLSFEQFMGFWNGTCAYCGNKINGVGIDRVDSSIGYIIENCVPCCKECNIMKNTKTVDEFITQCKRIVNNLEQIG